jgi:hypothetical protein
MVPSFLLRIPRTRQHLVLYALVFVVLFVFFYMVIVQGGIPWGGTLIYG